MFFRIFFSVKQYYGMGMCPAGYSIVVVREGVIHASLNSW